jgi:cell division protein FtsN
MARDYKNAAQKKEAPSSHAGSVLPFITGLSIGLFVAFIVFLNKSDGSYLPFQAKPSATVSVPMPDTRTPAANQAASIPALPTPTFDFYNILPNKEINISEWVAEEVTVQEPAAAQADQVSPLQQNNIVASTPFPMEENSVYILQVGSFKQLEAADQVKAQLALLGVMADIQRVVINGQDTLYRVRIGPYGDADQLNQARLRLQQNNLEFMLLKLQADDPRATDG